MMNQSIEMGRAFIMGIPAETHASFLALERNNSLTFSEHKYLLGVSISNQFSNFRNL
jgi:hypothetical protein